MAMTEVRSLGVALVLCMLGQATGMARRSCGVDARPHPKGLCGEQLLRAHQNLCFLLRQDYPELFGKRSLDRLLIFPVKSFAGMNVLTEGGDLKATTAPLSASDYNKMLLPLLPKGTGASPAAEPLSDYDLDLEGQVHKRGIVCDCCYNECSVSSLAQYC